MTAKAKTAFLFPGQGSQTVGMGKDFYEAFPEARQIFAEADEALGVKISAICFDGPDDRLKLTENTQPALLTVSTIAFRLLGVEPHTAAGHSLGEYSALVAAGTLSFADAVRTVRNRGRYMQEAVPVGQGAMAAVLGLSIEDVRAAIGRVPSGVVEIANWNSLEQIVLAGEKGAVEAVVEAVKPARAVMLPVSAPFHSRLMKPAEERLAVDLDRLAFDDPAFPVFTNVEARAVTTGEEARDCLKRQVSHPVLWYTSMEGLREEGVEIFVELGSGRVLAGLMKRISRRWEPRPQILNLEGPGDLENVRTALGA
jgi:[acyl-carrier-protein] S-malonyltransferase